MVDPERLLSLLERAAQEVAHLRGQGALGAAALRDRLQLDAAKYRLIVAIEACVDAADHVIASEGLRRPVSFADAFTALAEAGLLSEEIAATGASDGRLSKRPRSRLRRGRRRPGRGRRAAPA